MSELVDRQEVLKVIREMNLPLMGCSETEALLDAIKGLHALEKRKKGKWEIKWHFAFHGEVLICSQCRKGSPFRYDFCPNCGADMREEKDNG